ncbi:hypothetical protein ACIQ2D_07420 [Lysinibacillus sp. NPDC097287]|uniref:hypothetical protein n=1 Tax=Lysinibacillus sp. NPDC097287 TaxID=3364144 RepID=UPI00380D0D26
MKTKRFWQCIICMTTLFLISTTAQAAVIWDGAEVVKGQVGKMTFTKDVKVYKKNANGSFTSLVVKKGEFYRVYSVENSSVGKVYNMSGNYRVQATPLVVYREVPLSIQQQVSGEATALTPGTKLYTSSAGGVSVKVKPDVASTTIERLPNGIVLEYIQQVNGYYEVLFEYEKRKVQGYVPVDYVSPLQAKKKMVLRYNTELLPNYWNYFTDPAHFPNDEKHGSYAQGTVVDVYFFAKNGSAYVSKDEYFGYVEAGALADKLIAEPIVKGGFTPTANQDLQFEYGVNDTSASGKLKPQNGLLWTGTLHYSVVEDVVTVNSTYQFKESSSHFSLTHTQVNTGSKSFFTLKESLSFDLPVTVNDIVTYTYGDETTFFRVKKIHPTYTYKGQTFYNVIETSKGLIGHNLYVFDFHSSDLYNPKK